MLGKVKTSVSVSESKSADTDTDAALEVLQIAEDERPRRISDLHLHTSSHIDFQKSVLVFGVDTDGNRNRNRNHTNYRSHARFSRLGGFITTSKHTTVVVVKLLGVSLN